jgi:4-diphosphocytidyl-2-C-methyl-D-erythritol kinase
MALEKLSPCKVNLLLNILKRRPDGFHELETVMHPIPICDRLVLQRCASGVQLECDEPSLPIDSKNLVYRAAAAFLDAARVRDGARIRLEKRIPLAAGLGGGSGNAATTLLGLNELFQGPLTPEQLHLLAAGLGSDVPFFLQSKPALATGRGEVIEPLPAFAALEGAAFILIHPGFGIATAWAYQQLARFPEALNGRPGRGRELVELLEGTDLALAGKHFYNSLEAPALEKFPILVLYQEFFRNEGAAATLMSGSGSTIFAVAKSLEHAETMGGKFRSKFGATAWLRTVAAGSLPRADHQSPTG